MAEEKRQPISIVKIWNTIRNPDNVTLTDRGVEVHDKDVKVCEKIARKILKEDLK